ncbi:hypothetical protein TcCL_Unassigned05436 [Trypanosoma cruzi]|nr:hypothetical protein TcCL_Unassigned05436 [Trypanosoma cruzi]
MNGCVWYFGRTVRRPPPAFASCAEKGVSLGGKVAVRAWPSSRCVQALRRACIATLFFGVVTLSPSERLCRAWLAGTGIARPPVAVRTSMECCGPWCRHRLCSGACVCA